MQEAGSMSSAETAEDIIDRLAGDGDITQSRSEIEQRVDEKTEEMLDNQSSSMSEEDIRFHAAGVVKNKLKNISGGSGFGGGEAEEMPILTLGFQYKEGDYFVTDDDALLASGIVNPEDDPAGFAIFLLDSAHGVDMEYAMDCFAPLNTVRGYASRRQVGSRDGEPTLKKNGTPVYLINSTDESKFEQVDPDSVDDSDPISDLPADREAKREMINNNFVTEEDAVTLQTYAEHETVTNDNGYEIAFGADVKRIRGEVVDAVKFDGDDQSGDGLMTVTDDTVFGEEDIPEELISDQMRTPGLQVSCSGEFVYGENSVLDIYGFIEQRDDGQYRMQALGVIPIVEFEYDGYDGSSDSGDDDIEEDTI